jgi:hypothetical protein
VIGLRLARLSPACLRTLTLAAHLVSPGPAGLGHYRFNHTLVRDTLYDATLAARSACPPVATLRSDVAFGDIDLVRMRLSRSLPQEFSRDLDSSLAHRYLALVLAGLRGEAEGRHRSAARP